MGAFEYTALDSLGRSRKGVIEGDTARHVRGLLRERQLLPVSIEEVAQQESRRQQKSGLSFRQAVHAGSSQGRRTVGTTRSPGFRPLTSGPTSTISAKPSWPSTR